MFAAFIAAMVVAAILTPLVRNLALRRGWLDHALSARKVHGRPVPRLGGVAIVIGFYVPLLALLLANSEVGRRFWADRTNAIALLAGGLAIAVLGVWDDLRGMKAGLKFTIQFAVALFLFGMGARVTEITNPFGDPIQLGWLALPFTVLWITGVINAMNLIDGLDGLAGGVALTAISTTFVIAAWRGEPLMMLFAATLAGAVAGFLFYNFNPATIFMGDAGSMFLGFVLAATAIMKNQKSSTAVAIVVPIIALGIPIADTFLAMVRRMMKGVPIFQADRAHIHHRLMELGLSHRQAVLVLYGASVALGVVALGMSFVTTGLQAAGLLLGMSVVIFFALRRLGYLDLSRAQRLLETRRRNLDRRASVRRAGEALRTAESVEEIWGIVRGASRELGASGVALRLAGPRALAGSEPFEDGFEEAEGPLFRARYGLVAERPGEHHLELGFDDGRFSIDRDTEIAVELLCEHVSGAFDRLDRLAEARARGLLPAQGA
ncbi:MAG: MraY family glycosyltransferase [Anaeromyxobacteraceae bacterium]